MVFLGSYLVSAFLLGLLHNSCFSNIHCIYLHISLFPLSFLATNNTFPPVLLFFTFLYALLLVCHGIVVLFLFSTLSFQVHRFSLPLVLVLPQLTIPHPLVFSSLTALVLLLSWLLLCPSPVLFLFFPLGFPPQSTSLLLFLLSFVST